MANTGKLAEGVFIAIANTLAITSKDKDVMCHEPALYWFKAEVKKVYTIEDGRATVKLFFSRNDRDNVKTWVLTDDMFTDDTVITKDMIIAGTKSKASAYAWRWCRKDMRQKELDRVMDEDDLKEFIRVVEDNHALSFAEFSYNQLLIRFWEAFAMYENGTKSKMVQNASQQSAPPSQSLTPTLTKPTKPTKTATTPRKPKPAASPPTVARSASQMEVDDEDCEPGETPHVNKRACKRKACEDDWQEAFGEFKKAMNAKVLTLENDLNSMKKLYEECQSKISAIVTARENAAKHGIRAIKHNILEYVIPDALTSADCTRLKIFDKLLNGVTTFVRKVTDANNATKEHRITRCVRQLKESEDGSGPACLSRKLDVNYYVNHDAEMLPIAILEIEPEIADMSLYDAIKRWKYYSVCKGCTNNTSLKYMQVGKYLDVGKLEDSPTIAECVWDTCVFCMKFKKKLTYENIPLCGDCYNVASKDGNVEGGDNRLAFMTPVTYRFPWIKFVPKTWVQLCTSRGEKSTMEGPDCMFKVEIPMLDFNIHIMNEEDGGKGHSSYKVTHESTRLETLINVSTKNPKDLLFLVRVDPKAEFRVPDGTTFKPSFAVRMLVLRAWITWYIKNILSGKAMPKATILYLFYSHDNKHLIEAKKMAKKSKGRIVIGYSHTYPQDVLEKRDWRYCLTPNEGVLFRALSHNWQTNGLTMARASSAFSDERV
jgi:hypothetical protein